MTMIRVVEKQDDGTWLVGDPQSAYGAEWSNADRLTYAGYLLRWSDNPIGNPMTYEEWLTEGSE